MTEVSFAKQFLSVLDARPVKLSPDHVEDPKSYQQRAAYTLPRMPKPMSKPNRTTAPGSERSISVSVKSARNPPLDIKLPPQTLNTSILDIKGLVSGETSIPSDKMKILFKKKPVQDSKALKDLVAEGESSLEFSVMVMGGAAAMVTPKKEEVEDAQKDVAQGQSGAEVLQTTEFWSDLKGFLLQRLRDEQVAGDLTNTFQAAWKAKG
ncbi:cell-cycle control medial ring component [Xylariaceae sp. FL0016]|nr:cell-cycle control medial ring component [Xylariaceae sp. FL0016]